MEITEVPVELAHAIRRSVLPHLGPLDSRRFIGKTQSGDDAFAIDEVAETAIAEFIEHHRLSIAYHSENRRLVEFGKPKHLLIIDPIDGTRPAMAGLEDCVISIALAPYSKNACLSDVTFGCVLELKTGRLYTASKGGPAELREGTRQLGPTPLLDTSEANMQSCVAASNPLLHQRLLAEIDRNMQVSSKTIGVQEE